eukprot:g992.t1
MVTHFQLLVVVASRSRIEKESVLFQMFLRENRFKLLANGVKPPSDIFQSDSFATINVGLVANWLVRLTPEQHERFMQLKERFTKELMNREMIRDMEDKQHLEEEAQAQRIREHMDWQRGQRTMEEFRVRRAQRLEKGIEPDKSIPEDIVNAREYIEEIRRGEHGTLHDGLYDRDQQWVDPEFPHTDDSIGYCDGRELVQDWRVATAINADVKMFCDGTDPDDVHQGVLRNGWLLSAIQMLAASGGVGDDDVDPLVSQLFISGDNGKLSDVGAYGVRLHKNGQWETVIVDDYFPVLGDDYKDTKCNGAAMAYTSNFEELWVPLVEKAFAKYYGSYAALETGFPHFGLQDLTGGEAEHISIGSASRGAAKELFWQKIKKYKYNKYLLGAGTVSSDSADKEILDSGLVFGMTYVILRVIEVDGLRLLKLRNPPGDHGEWKGDWGDQSKLWTRRLKKKLGWSDNEDDGCFFMSFADFCQSFRTLYVGRYYDPARWKKVVLSDWWKKDLGTANGLPSKHCPHCKLEENPQFAIEVDRPTDLCIIMSQTDNGLPIGEPIEAACYLYKPPKPIGVGDAPTTSVRVYELHEQAVRAYSGDPSDNREESIYHHAESGHYTLLCAAYDEGAEGPFTVTIFSNHAVKVNQIWPPEWKRKGLDGPEKTLREKMVEKAKQGGNIVGGAAKKLADKKIAQARADLSKRTGGRIAATAEKTLEQKVAENAKPKEKTEDEIDSDTLQRAKELKKLWKKKTDGEGRDYYYNRETSVSTYEKPEGFMEKKDIRLLEMKVEAAENRRKVRDRAWGGRAKPADPSTTGFVAKPY